MDPVTRHGHGSESVGDPRAPCSPQTLPRHRPALSPRASSLLRQSSYQTSHFTPSLHQGLPHVPRERGPWSPQVCAPTATALSLPVLLTCLSESLHLLTACLSATTSATFLDERVHRDRHPKPGPLGSAGLPVPSNPQPLFLKTCPQLGVTQNFTCVHELKTWLPGDNFLLPPNPSDGVIPLAPENAAMGQWKSQGSPEEQSNGRLIHPSIHPSIKYLSIHS